MECGGKTPFFSRRDTSRQTQSGDTSPHSKQRSAKRGRQSFRLLALTPLDETSGVRFANHAFRHAQ